MSALRAALAIAAAALAWSGSPAPAHTAQAAKAKATAVGLGLREYRISVYRSSVPAGRVTLNSTNFGEDRHNVQVRGPKGYESAESAEIEPFGGKQQFTVRLKRPGTYTLICTLSDHEALGMRAKLKVKAAKAKKKK